MTFKDINWKVNGVLVAVLAGLALLFWGAKDETDRQKEEREQRQASIYSTDLSRCDIDTVLVDFVYYHGLRRLATLTMENGDKFLYQCGKRYLDVCNHLEKGIEVCYDHPNHYEVLRGHHTQQ
jgi:hypothetical protein